MSRFELESFGQTTAGIVYSWQSADKDGKGGLSSAQISFTALTMNDLSVTGNKVARVMADLPSGNYSRLIHTMFLSRQPGSCTHSIFVPVALLCLLSMLSLLLSDTASKTLVLSLTSLAILAYKTWLHTSLLPSLTYATRLTVYTDLHLALILMTVLHLVLGLLLRQHSPPLSSSIPMEPLERQDSLGPLLQDPKVRRAQGALLVRIYGGLLPVAFLLGQVVFWLSVLHLPDTQMAN